MEIERGSIRWQSAKAWLWQKLWTVRKADHVMMIMMMIMMMITTSITSQTSAFNYATTSITGDKIRDWRVFHDTDFSTVAASFTEDTVLYFVVLEKSLFWLSIVLTIPDFVGLNIKTACRDVESLLCSGCEIRYRRFLIHNRVHNKRKLSLNTALSISNYIYIYIHRCV